MWHYSGGYWGYNNLKIMDSQLKDNLDIAGALAMEVNQEFTFKLNINSPQYADLLKRDKLIVYVGTTLPGKKYSDLFYGEPSVVLEDNKVSFKVKPKFHFLNGLKKDYGDFVTGLDVLIPIVDPEYGYNRYSIYGRSSGGGYGAATGYFNVNNPLASAPAGMIAPSQILNKQGDLKNGFTVKATNGDGETSTRSSNEVSIGDGTFVSGGAVSIKFNYPITLSFYGEDTEDLSAQFESLPSSAAVGETMKVGIHVASTFETTQKDIPYKWSIKTKAGNVVPATFSGHINNQIAGEIVNVPGKGERMLYANFTMPNEDVHITFDMNKDGKSPIETYLDNNSLDSGNSIRAVKSVSTVGELELPYNVLTRKVRYPLAHSAIMAQLSLPRGSWNGNATGSLQVINNTTNVLREFDVTGNPAVNEASETITRNPMIHAVLKRTDFGDNPEGKDWLNLANPLNPKNKDGKVTFEGQVSRPYKYPYTGQPCFEGVCTTYTGYEPTSAAFNSGYNTKSINTFIYNGMKKIEKKEFKVEIDDNQDTSNHKKMYWESEPYDYNVIRWMYHLDENSNPYGRTPVGGQYERIFTQQASADMNGSIKRSIGQEYNMARVAAKNGTNKKSLYDHAVFATDRELQKYAYPIKSGYYFNPKGTYSFDMETVTYKQTKDKTKDHQELVDTLIDSFRYESDLIYIDNDKDAVNIAGQLLNKRGGGFERKSGILTAEHNKGVNGLELLTVERSYSKDEEEIEHSQETTGVTDPFWKMVLEGYGESDTSHSYSDYKYKEYVKDGQHMYEITEKTKVTITINQSNHKVYTHANMTDGDYFVKAWMADVVLKNSDLAYNTLPTLQGKTSLDAIKVTVKGSMYDDLNN
jgi:hypothetical protein